MGSAALHHCSVLIADDHHLVADAFREFLTNACTFDVTLARDVLEARAEIHAHGPFDILLLDLFMPGMEGAETIAELVRLNKGGKVVVLTGGTDPLNRSAIIASGAAGLIFKSQPISEILAALQSIRDGATYFPTASDRHPTRMVQPSRASLN